MSDDADRTPHPDPDGAASPQVLPHGSWPSPIGVELLTSGSVGLSTLQVDGDAVLWLEARPAEQGRSVLVRQDATGTRELTPPPFTVRSGVHEYGGGAYRCVEGTVVFSHHADGRLYLLDATADGAPPRPLTPDLPGRVLRYADLELDLPRRRVLAVREDHRGVGEPGGPAECVSTIVAVPLDGADPHEGDVLVGGHDFVSSPRLSPDGDALLWLTWEHPDMPWDASVLRRGGPSAEDPVVLAGGPGVSVTEIGWTPDGRPAWCTDETGWWNLVVDGEPVHPVDADCADPAWVFGDPGWAVTSDGALVLRRHDPDGVTLLRLPADGGAPVESRLAECREIVAAPDGAVVVVAGFADAPAAVVRIDPSGGQQVLRRSLDVDLDPALLSRAEPLSWPTPDGATSHGFLYRPRNPAAVAPDGELPPLLVLSHGGPTSSTSPALSPAVQFWTSRGFAVLDVDYGGSTGYGRAYRDRLQGTWGIVDVDDCCSGAQALAERGLVDPARMVIKGGSAGGYTTLAALAFRDVFAVGVSRYGIGDLETLATDTHKFESRYLDGLVGPYPEQAAVYVERSPIHHVDALDCALLLLQGEEDAVVPPDQAVRMADAVRAKGRPVALRLYPGEGHGFRRGETVRDALLTELAFHGRVLGFTPADDVPDVQIDNLD